MKCRETLCLRSKILSISIPRYASRRLFFDTLCGRCSSIKQLGTLSPSRERSAAKNGKSFEQDVFQDRQPVSYNTASGLWPLGHPQMSEASNRPSQWSKVVERDSRFTALAEGINRNQLGMSSRQNAEVTASIRLVQHLRHDLQTNDKP